MASTIARCASSALLGGALEPLCSSSTATHTVAFFCPVKNGLEFASQAVVRGSSSSVWDVRSSSRLSNKKNFKGIVRVSSAGVMESAPPATRDDPVIVNVDLGDRSYPIYIGAGLLDRPELLQKHISGKKVRDIFCLAFEFLRNLPL